MEIVLSNTFYPLLQDDHRYLVLCGGAGSGKSEFAARKLFYRCMTEGGHRFLVLRKVRSRCRESVVEVMIRLLRSNKIEYEQQKTERTITFRSPNGKTNEILFDGLDDPDKIKSIAGLTGLWLEETTEFSEPDFTQLDIRLREPGPGYHQIIMTFNPDEASGPWLKRRFFDHIDPDAAVHVSTIEDNPIAEMRETYKKRLDRIQDKTARDIYRYGIWALAKGRIFNWDVVSAPPTNPDAIFFGGDFGYSVDPAALIKIYRKANEYWLEEIIYSTGLTNQDLARKAKLDPRFNAQAPSYWDSAEPKSIEELFREGLNVLPSIKGEDSVRAGIDFLRSLKIHIIEGSENIKIEVRSYRYKVDKNGDPLPDPIDYKDHAMSATRYGIVTHMRGCREIGYASGGE
jgi:phage terminase large subunit